MNGQSCVVLVLGGMGGMIELVGLYTKQRVSMVAVCYLCLHDRHGHHLVIPIDLLMMMMMMMLLLLLLIAMLLMTAIRWCLQVMEVHWQRLRPSREEQPHTKGFEQRYYGLE
jgi:hypothetical protein